MDQIWKKINAGEYATLEAFTADFDLMFKNACTYNVPESLVYQDAKVLESVFYNTLNGTTDIISDEEKKSAKRKRSGAEGTSKKARPSAAQSPYPGAAFEVLDQHSGGYPMHYKVITDRAIELGLVVPTGRTPSNTMNGQINKSDMFYAAGKVGRSIPSLQKHIK